MEQIMFGFDTMEKHRNKYSDINRYVVFDIETTGFSPKKGDKIIEIGAVKVINGQVVETFSELIDPLMPLHERITELTGITNEDLKGKPTCRQVLPKFYNFIKGEVLVAHNAKFDYDTFMKYYMQELEIYLNNVVYDTMLISRELVPQLISHSLDSVCGHFKIKNKNHHRAFEDASATAELFEKLKKISV